MVGLRRFRCGVLEGATAELILSEPFAQEVEEREQPAPRGFRPGVELASDSIEPATRQLLQPGDDEVVLGGEVVEEGRLRTPEWAMIVLIPVARIPCW